MGATLPVPQALRTRYLLLRTAIGSRYRQALMGRDTMMILLANSCRVGTTHHQLSLVGTAHPTV